jgi:transposase
MAVYRGIRGTGKCREGSKNKRNTAKQFVDFIKRIDRRYGKNIQNIFLVLDNLSAHKSKKIKGVLAKDCPRIKFVFLPVLSPELNLIEVR